jgi:hypothetical protein
LLGRPSGQHLWSPHHAAHWSPRLLELPQQSAADVAGRPGEQNAPGGLLHGRRYRVMADSHPSPVCRLRLEIVRLELSETPPEADFLICTAPNPAEGVPTLSARWRGVRR